MRPTMSKKIVLVSSTLLIVLLLAYVPSSTACGLRNVGSLPVGLDGPTCVSDGESVFIFGGKSNESADPTKDTIYRFDTESETLTKLPETLPVAAFGSVSVWTGTEAYIFGGTLPNGSLSQHVTRFTPPNKVESLGDIMPYGAKRPATFYDGSKVYMLGNCMGSLCGNTSLMTFDPNTLQFEVTEDVLPNPIAGMSAAYVEEEGAAYLFGGRGPNVTYTDIYKFTTGQGLEKQHPVLLDPTFGSSAVRLGDGIFIIGGKNTVKGNTWTSRVMFYNLSTGEVRDAMGAQLGMGAFRLGVAVVDEYIYLAGGFNMKDGPLDWILQIEVQRALGIYPEDPSEPDDDGSDGLSTADRALIAGGIAVVGIAIIVAAVVMLVMDKNRKDSLLLEEPLDSSDRRGDRKSKE